MTNLEKHMHKININNVISVQSQPNKTILETMESAGLQPEYHCRDGHCGACKCELIAGEIEETNVKMAYTHQKEILPCISKAKSNLILNRVNYQIKARSA